MKIPEKLSRQLLLIVLTLMVLALFTVVTDYSGFTGNQGLSERGFNTLILVFIISPFTIITLSSRKFFSIYCKSINYLFSVGKESPDNNKVQYIFRILLFMSFFCAVYAVIDWVGITSSGLDSHGENAVILTCLFLLAAIFLRLYERKKKNMNNKTHSDQVDKVPNIKTLVSYSSLLILVLISFFILLKLPGNIYTSIIMLVHVWALLMLISRIAVFVFRLTTELKVNMFLSVTVFMAGIVVIELFLRYGISAHTTYLERNGFSDYISLYDTKVEGERDEYIERYYVHQPNMECTLNLTEFDYKLKTNSMGIRNKEISTVKDSNEFRIICLGDSFTEGIGVDEDNCWPRILERELTKNILKRKINIINAGSAGSDVVFEYTFLKEQLLKYSPDLVIVCLNTSDISDICVRGGFERFKSENTVQYKSPPVWEPIYGRSYIFRHIIHDFFKFDPLFIPERNMETEMLNSVKIINSTLLRFEDLSGRHNFKFVTVLHPNDYEIIYDRNTYSTLLEALSGNVSNIFDMNDYFINECGLNKSNISEYFWEIDKHYNIKGYFLLAKGIERYLFDSGLLTESQR